MLAPRVPGLVLMSFLLTQVVHVANFFKKYLTVLATHGFSNPCHFSYFKRHGDRHHNKWGKVYDTRKLNSRFRILTILNSADQAYDIIPCLILAINPYHHQPGASLRSGYQGRCGFLPDDTGGARSLSVYKIT